MAHGSLAVISPEFPRISPLQICAQAQNSSSPFSPAALGGTSSSHNGARQPVCAVQASAPPWTASTADSPAQISSTAARRSTTVTSRPVQGRVHPPAHQQQIWTAINRPAHRQRASSEFSRSTPACRRRSARWPSPVPWLPSHAVRQRRAAPQRPQRRLARQRPDFPM